MTNSNNQDFDPYAGLDDDVQEAPATSDDYDPFFDDDVEPAPTATPPQPAPQPAPRQPAPQPKKQQPEEIIDADADDFEEDEIDEDNTPVFRDYAPRPTRFTAPTAADVMADDADIHKPDSKPSKPSRAADKEAERAARRQEREEAKQQKLAEKEEAKRQKQAEREERNAARKAAKDEAKQAKEQTAAPTEPKTPRDKTKKSPAVAVAAGLLVLAGIGGGGYLFLTGNNDDAVVAQEPENNTDTEDAVDTATSGDSSAQEPTFAEVAAQKCQESGGTSENGDGSTPEGAIRAFNHAYYVDKSAEEAIKYLGDEMYDSEESLQEGIDHEGNGDAYCLTIEDGDQDNQYSVQLTEYMEPERASADPEARVTDQTMTMTDDDGWKVKSISID